ncbi:uncharacterized protein LOC129296692 [Prosopis cineraria]|uniref:uncharacterized protein LOC129296692 n=1 Tax=Prosopis cineraria TaxID=364024 RepID=UPI00240F42AD|nr:uncharacterized protein LOC129296692 [Prosopis cineraria]
MARKGNQQKNGMDPHGLNHKKVVSGPVLSGVKGHAKGGKVKVFPGEECSNGNHSSRLSQNAKETTSAGDGNNNVQNSEKISRKEKQGMATKHDLDEPLSFTSDPGECSQNAEVPIQEENEALPRSNQGQLNIISRLSYFLNGFLIKSVVEKGDLANNLYFRRLRLWLSSIFTAFTAWLTRQRPLFVYLMSSILKACEHLKMKIQQAYPVVLKWLLQFGNIMLLLSVFWLDCALRGVDSFVRMGTVSFFSVIWCSIFSVIGMIGMLKFLVILGLAALIGFFVGLTLAILVVAILGVVFLWIYGSFWTTATFIFLGGLAYKLSHERIALLITTVYSVYCARLYAGWLGLLLALNLSFISSDVLIYFLKKRINQQSQSNASPEHRPGMQGQPDFSSDEPMHTYSENGPGPSVDRSAGVPSTSGADFDLPSEEEVVRLLNCSDHYSVLGLTRYQNIDASLVKREYRKKAMLVHPDKNMGDEKAAEAFKKLQNAYEVLMDSLKRKAYDDELRREELLSIFRRFQTASQSHKNGRQGFFPSGFTRSDADSDDLFRDSRRISCKKCGSFHIWIHTKKQKSRARWCQDCQDFHQAKDGDGWVEQLSQPFLFGLLQKVDLPSAYVCADSQIYDATEWYTCQGMRCPANTHKPSFHVNTSLTSKHGSSKGSHSGQRGGRMPTMNVEETMTEEEFFEWLQNAAQAGMFDNFGGSAAAESPSKSGSGGSSGGNGSKRKKKGKKQR